MSEINWESFWQKYRLIDIKNDSDLLYQVGKTIEGNVIAKRQFDFLVHEVLDQLELTKKDKLLDLCCGNGILTQALAPTVHHIIGIDFSEPYINNAKKFCNRNNNIEYHLHDVNNLATLLDKLQSAEINKVLVYDALAYFDKHQLKKMMETINAIRSEGIQIMLASVLDKNKKWSFFNTPARKWNYFFNIKLLGRTQGLGRWWRRKTFEKIAADFGLQCKFLSQNPQLHTAHYRMNVILKK